MVLTEFNEERYGQVMYRDGYLDGKYINLFEIYDKKWITLEQAVESSGLSEEKFLYGFNGWKEDKTLLV